MAAKKQQATLKIVKIEKYKGSDILVQYIVQSHLFQAIIYKEGNYYQLHEVFTPEKGEKDLTEEQITYCAATILQYAYQVADELDNPTLTKEEPVQQELPKGIKAD